MKVLRTFCGIRGEKSSGGIAARARAEREKELITIDFFTILHGVVEGNGRVGDVQVWEQK